MNQTSQTKVLLMSNWQKPVVLSLAGIALVLGVFYIYFLASSFGHAYDREASIELLNTLRADVATVETEYNIALSSSLTADVAYARGFRDASPVLAYVPVKTSAPTGLALRSEF